MKPLYYNANYKRKQKKILLSKKARSIPGPCFPAFCFLYPYSVGSHPTLYFFSSYLMYKLAYLSCTLHQSILPWVLKATPAATKTYLACRTSASIILIIIPVVVPTCHVYRFPNLNSSWRSCRSLSFYICSVMWIVHSVFPQGMFKFLVQQMR